MSSTNPKGNNTLANTSTPRLPTQKLTAIARLKSFGGSFVNRQKEPPIVFPPPSWELSDDLLGSSRVTPVALAESNFEDPPPPEPISFAKKLRGLIESLPLPGTSSSAPTTNANTADTQGNESQSESALPVPAGLDESLVRMLSSEELMNGKLRESSAASPSGEGSPGIWNILAGLKKDGGKEGESASTPSTVEEDEDGLMMYAPLEPKDDSQLQLAESETILEYVDDPRASTSKPSEPKSGTAKGRSPERHSEQVVEKHIWVPSTTQLSLLTTWWGYRLYLPPAVMVKLNATSLKATARAAMITTALKWLLDKIPMMLVPVQFRPAVTILKRMSPVTSYIGVFIAWSWDRIRSLDKGNGVVLTATWVLPVALLPMSWDAGDIYRPIAAPTPEEIAAAQEAAAKAAAEEAAKEQAKEASGDQGKQKRSFFRW